MSVLLLLLVVILWMTSQSSGDPSPPTTDLRAGLAAFFGFYALLVLLTGIWSRSLAQQIEAFTIHRALRRFQKVMMFARVMVPVGFGLGVYWLGWGWFVPTYLDFVPDGWPIKLPSVLLGIAPAIVAWMGLWWSQYPADRALREQSLLALLDAGLPVHAPPRFFRYVVANFRLQVLMAILPVLLVVATRDVIVVGVRVWNPALPINDAVDTVASLLSLATVYLLAPLVLVRALDTRPLPDGPLRRRLTALCARTGMRARGILVWQTNSLMGNAAVMGLFPRVRFVLMTDLLLETMTDEQIEAVFAHEIGHIRHRHLLWYVALIACFILLSMGPGDWLDRQLVSRFGKSGWIELGQAVVALGLFWLGFGFVSRRFERQADVFAARVIDRDDAPPTVPAFVPMPGTLQFANGELVGATTATGLPAPVVVVPAAHPSVGPYGATLFASALKRVAVINNIPVSKREWIHGSIAGRMDFVQSLATSPNHTVAFDRRMARLNVTLVLVVAGSAGLLYWMRSIAAI